MKGWGKVGVISEDGKGAVMGAIRLNTNRFDCGLITGWDKYSPPMEKLLKTFKSDEPR